MYYFTILLVCFQLMVVDPSIADTEQNPESGDLFEGDIIKGIDQRAGIPKKSARWPFGTMVYSINPGFSLQQKKYIYDAMREIGIKTKGCIKFRPGRGGAHVVFTHSGNGCSSRVGRFGKLQRIFLANGCFGFGKGRVMHEIYHALGFWHEHTRPDRDKYVQIVWSNIQKKHKNNFKAHKNALTYKLGYDYGSIMHYASDDFGVMANNKPKLTIRKLKKGPAIGQRKGLSVKDIHKMRRMYGCEKY